MTNYRKNLHKITTLIFDYDGVMTDGKVLFTDDGQQLRSVNVRDGYALQLASKKGFRIVVLSGADTEGMRKRCESKIFNHVFLGISDKQSVFNDFINSESLKLEEIMYMGDDIPDLPVLSKVGIAACPADACEEVKKSVHYISPFKGGNGCVRDIIEQILKVHGQWMDQDAFHW